MSALAEAAWSGDVGEVRRLLKEVDPVHELDSGGTSVIWLALVQGHTPVVKCLIQEGGVNINLLISISHGKPRCFLLLLAAQYGSTR